MTHPTWPDGWMSHAPRKQDVNDVVSMFNARSQRLLGKATSSREHVEGWWGARRVDADRDFLIVRDDRNIVAGIAAADDRGAPYASIGCIAVAHPAHDENERLWDSLYAWAFRRASEIAAKADDRIRVVAAEQSLGADTGRLAALDRAGFRVARVMLRMGIDLVAAPPAPKWPEGITWRTAHPTRDMDSVIDVRREIWRDHWGAIERPREDLVRAYEERMTEEGELFDPELQVFALDGDEVVGLLVARSHIAKDPRQGFIGFLGTRRRWRRRGIGRALLRHALCELHRKGRGHVELDVDAESLTDAVRLYERAGMRVIRRVIHYEKEIRAGADLVTRELPNE